MKHLKAVIIDYKKNYKTRKYFLEKVSRNNFQDFMPVFILIQILNTRDTADVILTIAVTTDILSVSTDEVRCPHAVEWYKILNFNHD